MKEIDKKKCLCFVALIPSKIIWNLGDVEKI